MEQNGFNNRHTGHVQHNYYGKLLGIPRAVGTYVKKTSSNSPMNTGNEVAIPPAAVSIKLFLSGC